MASQCTFGYFTGKTCHVTTYCSTTGLISIDLLDPQEREVILWRAGLIMINVDTTLCCHHNYIISMKVAVTLLAFTVLLEKVIASISFKQFLLIWLRYKCSMKYLY